MLKPYGPLLGSFLMLQILGWAFWLYYGQRDAFLILHAPHIHWANALMPWITWLGDGYFALSIALLILPWHGWRIALAAGVAFLSSGLLVQGLKIGINWPRPSALIQDIPLRQIEGYTIHQQFSFPSGHSTTAWAIMIFLSLLYQKRIPVWLWLIPACLASWSRIYLAQHFLEDVLAGAMVGFTFSWSIYHFLEKNKYL